MAKTKTEPFSHVMIRKKNLGVKTELKISVQCVEIGGNKSKIQCSRKY